MSEPGWKRMTVDEFLVWDDGTDTRYELIDGVPVAMAPTYGAHQIIASSIGRHLGNALDKRPPCHVRSEAGVLKPNSFRRYFQADLAVTCSRHEPGQHAIPDPVLIVEVLPRSTQDHDRKVKLPVYRAIPSVREILLVHAEMLFAEVHRRLDATRWQVDLLVEPEDVLRLDSVGFESPVGVLYANVDLGPGPTGGGKSGNSVAEPDATL